MPAHWSNHETVVVVYFASRGAGHEACRKILALKCAGTEPEPRTMLAVRGKLDQIRKIPGLWNETNGWDRAAVDTWLVRQGVDNLEALVGVGYEEIGLVPQVGDRTETLKGS